MSLLVPIRGPGRGLSPLFYSGLATAIAVLALIPQTPASAQTLPTGGAVTNGAASIVQPNATTLNINQSSNQAIINWNTFSVGRGDTVNFNQPSAASSTLNRVIGSTPSWIAGTINAPGTVLLINPNGIEITKSGVVNTGSFVASSLNITDSNYLSRNYSFSGKGASAGVINGGRINVSDGGFAALLGGQVSNNGIISARLGKVALGAGEEATLDLSGDGFLSVGVPSSELGKLVSANGALVSNRGKIIADGGTVFLSAATAANILRNAVNIPGSIRTNSVGTHDGRIVINGGGGSVSITGKLAANGGKKHNGGEIAVAGNDVTSAGNISASGRNGGAVSLIASNELALTGTLMAQGYEGHGGTAAVTAADVTLTGATVNASGASGGGLVLIGGDFQGGNGDPSSALYQDFAGRFATLPTLASAQTVSIDAASTINVSATNSGNAGTAVIWSQQQTDFAGSIIGTGGPNGGSGGYAEVSSEGVLNFTGAVDFTASAGNAGTLLLDPYTVTIVSGTGGTITGGSFTANANSTIGATTLDNALASSNVIISSGTGQPDTAGSIILDPGVTLGWKSGHTLTLDSTNAASGTLAGGTISLSGSIYATSNSQSTGSPNGGLILEAGGNISTGNIAAASLTIDAAGTVTQASSTSITATNLLLEGGGSYALTNASNSIRTLAGNAGTIDVNDGSSLVIGSVGGTAGVTGSGPITLTATGNLTIGFGDPVKSTGSGNNIVLSATGNFINLDGSSAVSTAGAGTWLIYSNNPTGDTFDNLNSNNTAIWDTTYSPSVSAIGDRYVFAYRPTLTFTANNVDTTYGQTATLTYTVSGYEPGVSGAFIGDSAANVYNGSPTLSSAGTAALANVGGYQITIAQGSVTSLNSYAFAFTNGTLTIDPAMIALNGRKIYDGNGVFTAADFGNNGVVNGVDGQTLTVTGFGFVLSPNVSAGTQFLIPLGLGLANGPSGPNQGLASNYQVSFLGNSGTITPATLTYIANPASMTYGGTVPALSGTLTGFIPGQNLANATAGTLVFTTTANSSSNVNSYAINGSGLTADNGNYVFVQAAANSTAFTVNPAPITLTGSKVYDANTTFAAADFGTAGTISTGIGTQTLVLTGSGSVGSANASPTSQVLNATGLTLINGTGINGGLASNYVIATSGNTGTITPATITLVGTMTYDASTVFAASDFGTNGIISTGIGNQTLTLSGSGSVSSPNVNAGTQPLTLGGLALGNGTGINAGLASNYQIATSGNTGTITPATLTVTPNAASTTYSGVALNNTAYSDSTSNYSITGFVSTQTVGSAGITLSGSMAFGFNGAPGLTTTSVLNAGTYSQGTGTLAMASNNNNYVMNFVNPAPNSPTPNNYVIIPATLTYVANPSTQFTGVPFSALTGTVTGFVDNQTVASATTGTLQFTSPATPASKPDTYAIDGSGLTANFGNYVFVQAADNAAALTLKQPVVIIAPPTSTGGAAGGTTITFQSGATHAPPLTTGFAPPLTTGSLGDQPRVFDIPAPTETHFATNEVLVQVNCDTPQQAIDAVAHDMHLSIIASKCMDQSHKMVLRLHINSGHSVADVIRALEQFQIIAVAQPNYGYQAQPDAQRSDPAVQTEANAAIQYALAKLDLTAIHQIVTGAGIKIAVIDSQIDVKNPELAGDIAGEFDAVGTIEPPDVHGTEMAGVIAAHDRLTGVAPAAEIYAIHAFSRAGDTFGSSTFNIVNALNWAIGQDVRVINMSFTGPRDPSIDRALQIAHDKGIVLVAAAGNFGPDSPPLYPGADPNVIAVTATDSNDMVFSGANRGNYISVAAPGVDIAVPAPQASYQLTTGTSVAAAEVSGVVALLLQRNPALTPDDIRTILTSTAKHPGGEEHNDTYGWGLIDLAKAVQAAADVRPAPTQ